MTEKTKRVKYYSVNSLICVSINFIPFHLPLLNRPTITTLRDITKAIKKHHVKTGETCTFLISINADNIALKIIIDTAIIAGVQDYVS